MAATGQKIPSDESEKFVLTLDIQIFESESLAIFSSFTHVHAQRLIQLGQLLGSLIQKHLITPLCHGLPGPTAGPPPRLVLAPPEPLSDNLIVRPVKWIVDGTVWSFIIFLSFLAAAPRR